MAEPFSNGFGAFGAGSMPGANIALDPPFCTLAGVVVSMLAFAVEASSSL